MSGGEIVRIGGREMGVRVWMGLWGFLLIRGFEKLNIGMREGRWRARKGVKKFHGD